MLWEYSGLIRIERLTGDTDGYMELPFCFNSPDHAPSLTLQEIEERARQIARDWVAWRENTFGGTRQDYGETQSVELTAPPHLVDEGP